MARETVTIAERGYYQTDQGLEVRVDVAPAIDGTRLYLPDDVLAGRNGWDGAASPAFEVTGESTLAAARRLGGDVAALVFASARSPGGGFLNGAEAQEESIARSSALYPCLLAVHDFYAYHRTHHELTYTDRVIYSPAVPVFRDDHGDLLPAAYPVSFITAAAPNRGAIRGTQPDLLGEVEQTLRRRARRVVEVAAAHGHQRLVLGAWGCGVFGNDPAMVAQAFADALRGMPFEQVVFAVLGPNRPPFTEVFAAQKR